MRVNEVRKTIFPYVIKSVNIYTPEKLDSMENQVEYELQEFRYKPLYDDEKKFDQMFS